MSSRVFPIAIKSVRFPTLLFALRSSPFDLANYHIISLEPISRDHVSTIQNYPLPHEHRILTPCQNSTSVSPPTSRPPTFEQRSQTKLPLDKKHTLTTIISSKVLEQNNSIHPPSRQSRFLQFCLWSRQILHCFHEGTESDKSVSDEGIDLSKPIGPFWKDALPCPVENTGGVYSIWIYWSRYEPHWREEQVKTTVKGEE